jgi:hypothetical protein
LLSRPRNLVLDSLGVAMHGFVETGSPALMGLYRVAVKATANHAEQIHNGVSQGGFVLQAIQTDIGKESCSRAMLFWDHARGYPLVPNRTRQAQRAETC